MGRIRWQREGFTAWVCFNNDLQGYALLDAFELADLLGEPVHMLTDTAEPSVVNSSVQAPA